MEFILDKDNNLYIDDDNELILVNMHYLTMDDIGLCYTSNLLKQLLKQKCTSKFLLVSTIYALCYRIQQYQTAIQTQKCLDSLNKIQRSL
ncbi:MAG: hypothetical protein MJZ34_13760 [Paludibacteraceae bacterium]|nr:hypothetical protein [Paludibacteraceae bacterium]